MHGRVTIRNRRQEGYEDGCVCIPNAVKRLRQQLLLQQQQHHHHHHHRLALPLNRQVCGPPSCTSGNSSFQPSLHWGASGAEQVSYRKTGAACT